MNEEWRDIPGWEGAYSVSSEGRVKSFKIDPTGVILSPSLDAYGYLQFSLKRPGYEKKVKVHRIIWEVFRGMIPDSYDIDHLNTIKTDNRIANLDCVTKQENHRRATRDGLKAHGEHIGAPKLTVKEVIEIRLSDENNAEIARRFGVSPGLIYLIKRRAIWKHVL